MPAEIFSRWISPVLVFILTVSEADVLKLTSPVLAVISASVNVKLSGISISPVCSFMKRERYLGRTEAYSDIIIPSPVINRINNESILFNRN